MDPLLIEQLGCYLGDCMLANFLDREPPTKDEFVQMIAEFLEQAGVPMEETWESRLLKECEWTVPQIGEPEPGCEVVIFWHDFPEQDRGYLYIAPHEDEDIGACVHVPEPQALGDRDVSPEWMTLGELMSNPAVRCVEFVSINAVREYLLGIKKPFKFSDDWCPADTGNFDDTFNQGTEQGERWLASDLRKMFCLPEGEDEEE